MRLMFLIVLMPMRTYF